MDFMNIRLDNINRNEAFARILHMAKTGGCDYVVTPNVDHIVMLEKDALFRKAYEHASLVVDDSQILLWISKLYRQPIVEKVSGPDYLVPLCEKAREQNLRVLLFGAAPEVAEMAAGKIRGLYPGIDISAYSPPFGFENDDMEIEASIRIINQYHPHIMVLGLGSPKQERFVYTHRERMQANVVLCTGASIDYAAGKVRREPIWMNQWGLAWFYRLCTEPGRLFKRYLVQDLKILPLMIKYRPKSSHTAAKT